MNQQNHRIIGAIGVPLVLFFLQANKIFSLNIESIIILIVGALVGYLTGGGTLSPDMDIQFKHRNLFTHSTLIPYILVVLFQPIFYLYALAVMVLVAWTLHVVVDYFSERDEFALEVDPSEWAWGIVSYVGSIIITVLTWASLFGIPAIRLTF